MSGTADGKRLVLWRSNAAWQTFIASLDPASHQWKEPRRLTLDANANIADAWTADSKAVLFFSNRNGTWKLFKQAIDETTPEVLAEGRSPFLPRLSADGSQVLYVSSSNPDDVSYPASVMSKPLAGGAPRIGHPGEGDSELSVRKGPVDDVHLQPIRRPGSRLPHIRFGTWSGARTVENPATTPHGVFRPTGRSLPSFPVDIASDSFPSVPERHTRSRSRTGPSARSIGRQTVRRCSWPAERLAAFPSFSKSIRPAKPKWCCGEA